MTTSPPESAGGDPRFWEQLRIVREAGFDVETGPAGAGPGSDVPPAYVYERGALLVRDRVVADVVNAVPGARMVESPVPGVTKLRISEPVPDALGRLDRTPGLGPGAAAPNHLVFITGVNLCPGDEPVSVPAGAAPVPAAEEGTAGQDVQVLVIDTGVINDVEDPAYLARHPWLAGVSAFDGRYDQPLSPTGQIIQYTGHGTFIAGVLRCVAPGTAVSVSNALVDVGAILEDRLGAVLLGVLPGNAPWPDIISLSAGAKTRDGHPPIGLDPFIRRLSGRPGTVLVAAAGNHGESAPFWPAAYAGPASGPVPGVVSVGALREPGNGVGRACFSNHGDWVTVFAPGERLVNAYLDGVYEYMHSSPAACRHWSPAIYQGCTCVAPEHAGSLSGAAPADQDKFSGMASWSGTSFATPIVAARIAALTARTWQETGVRDARAAAERLVASLTVVEDCADGMPLPVLP